AVSGTATPRWELHLASDQAGTELVGEVVRFLLWSGVVALSDMVGTHRDEKVRSYCGPVKGRHYLIALTPPLMIIGRIGGEQVASPTVMYAVRQKDGSNYIVDDYYKGYKWLEKNTAEDARVMAWWDYGYQITGIGNRTSIADGNTWNHEHIATLGRTLTSEVKRAHNAIRHLADYVLVWGGGQRDDLGKSPHLARIGNSVFPDHCGDDDPKCTKFGFYADRSPTPMMEKSLLYKLVEHNKKGVRVNERYFKHVHTTKHGLMRIYEVQNVSQESKDWIADPKNRVCDAPGSWYCVGQYPPALSKLIAKRRNFAQIEDFNRKGEKSAYTRLIEKEKGEL
ncbi:STT3B, partial [Symbiodinium sp. KB8]